MATQIQEIQIKDNDLNTSLGVQLIDEDNTQVADWAESTEWIETDNTINQILQDIKSLKQTVHELQTKLKDCGEQTCVDKQDDFKIIARSFNKTDNMKN